MIKMNRTNKQGKAHINTKTVFKKTMKHAHSIQSVIQNENANLHAGI